MQLTGEWLTFIDGEARPILTAEIRRADRSWQKAMFLIDTGADETLLSSGVLGDLGLPTSTRGISLSGAGGAIRAANVSTELRLRFDGGEEKHVAGNFAVALDDVLEISILGRDILSFFTLIADKRRESVLLLGEGHDYRVQAVDE